MIQALQKRWVLILVLILFCIAKYPHLSYPYYWDESWPYAPAVEQMYQHGPSLLPSAIHQDLSRGHPLFFHAAAAVWANIFGLSHFSMHSFALFISLLFLIAIYEVGLRLFNMRVAIMSLLLVCTQLVFFIQASYLLLEVLVALLAFMSLYHYIKGNYLQLCIYLCALFYTKESGLIMGFVLGVDALAQLRHYRSTGAAVHVKRLAAIGIPCIITALFFIIQKQTHGWYVLPLHADLARVDWIHFWHNLSKLVADGTFARNYRQFYYALVLAVLVYAAIKQKWYGLFFLPVTAVLIYFMYDKQDFIGSILHLIGFLIAIWASVYFMSRPAIFPNVLQRRFVLLAGCFFVCFTLFSSFTFYTSRYLIISIVPSMCLLAILADRMTSITLPRLFYPLLVGMMGVSALAYKNNDGFGDTDLGCFDAMDVQKGIINYLEDHNYYDKKIATSGFLETQHMENPATGYLRGKRTFTKVQWGIDLWNLLIVFDNIEPDIRYSKTVNDTNFVRIYRIDRGTRWGEIYARRHSEIAP